MDSIQNNNRLFFNLKFEMLVLRMYPVVFYHYAFHAECRMYRYEELARERSVKSMDFFTNFTVSREFSAER